MKLQLALVVYLLGVLWMGGAEGSLEQFGTCKICRTLISDLMAALGQSFTEEEVSDVLHLGCTSFGIDSWCAANLYPSIHDIFDALRTNKTDGIVCERIALCKFRVVSITGDILFADGDVLYTIKELSDGRIQHTTFGTVSHPAVPNGVIQGLACSADYCAVLLVAKDSTGKDIYGTTALSPYTQISHTLPSGYWYGPWFDIITEEFWMATGSSKLYTFGIFDPQFGEWQPKLTLRFSSVGADSEILSGQILDRILYFTILNDFRVYKIDLALRLSRGNFTAMNNTMLVGNPVTNELYGYAPGPQGIWRFDANNRTTVGVINLTGALPVPSSTINPIENTMWISLWGNQRDAWLRVDLKKTTDNIGWAPTGNLDGLFDFNPYTIVSEEV